MGKDAFEAKKGTFFRFDPDELVIVTDKDDPLYDPREQLPVNEGLVSNLLFRMQGVLEPIIVYKDANRAVVCDGRQRVKAAREANRRLREQGLPTLMVPAMYRPGVQGDLQSIMISANEYRRDDSPIEKAEKVQRFMNNGGSRVEAAQMFGVSVPTIGNWLALLNLTPEVAKQVRENKITAKRGVEISKVPRKEQAEAVAKPVAKMRSEKEIRAKLAEFEEDAFDAYVVSALRWVLGINRSL